MTRSYILALALGGTVIAAPPVMAQQVDLMAMDVSDLKPEVARRYDESLAATKAPEILSSTSSAFMWASEAKVQCGIATGFLKSGTKDADSLSKCERYHRLITQAPASPAPMAVPEPPRTNATCDALAGTFFFEWNSADVPSNVDETAAFIAANKTPCGWNNFAVTGHTDRSGSDAYNNRLSVRRAEAVGQRLQAAGISSSNMIISGRGETELKVATPDGERNPTNRRVEVTVSN